jgi:hypothetical protein
MRQKDEIWRTYRGNAHTKRKNRKPEKFYPGGSKMEDIKCNVFQYTGTNGQAEKHTL